MDVEGREFEEGEEAMKDWVTVRRKGRRRRRRRRRRPSIRW